jgi:hypothetical protein
MTEKNKGGRPRIETRIPDGWENIILDAGREGKHITDFLVILGISWQGHYDMMKRNKKYYETINEYEKLCENWWFEKARISMEENNGLGFNSRLWSLIMRNKFNNNWTEATKVDVTSKGESIDKSPIQIEIIRPKDTDGE